MVQIDLNTPLQNIPGIGPKFFPKLKKLGLKTAGDLIRHFPAKYEDYSNICQISDLVPGKESTIQGNVLEIKTRRSWGQRRLFITEAVISDDSNSIKAIWFNQVYIKNHLKPGQKASFSGKVISNKKPYLLNPGYELIYSQKETTHTGRIISIYPETKGLTSKGLRRFIKMTLERVSLKEWIPLEIRKSLHLPDINKAYKNIHFPEKMDDAETAKKRFTFEDLFLLQIHNIFEKAELAEKSAPRIKISVEEIKKLLSEIPFELTLSQKKSLWEIMIDLEKPYPMNRLLQGDVGSGKTIVAAIAALKAADAGWQATFMAPTEILARQHYLTLTKLFPKTESGIGLLTSSDARIRYGPSLDGKTTKKHLIEEIKKGNVGIVIGTHALIQKEIDFKNPGLVIIDEQHRFGVKQRKTLLSGNEEGKNQSIPHFLSMTATPIPRTLALTIFSDLDLSLITEMPKGRKNIITKVIPPSKRNDAYEFIRKEVKEGRQIFVICPRIEKPQDDENINSHEHDMSGDLKFAFNKFNIDVKSVKEEYEKLSKDIFPELHVAMIHGKIKAQEKEKTMTDFAEGKTDILVSTSVVEVGVDIPNATVMMIEGSERFGLAQLYQFRGRVGRGKHQSYCLLFTDSNSSSVHSRLKSITEAKNGLELAEKDLKLRGPGELLGISQTGMPDLAMKAIKNPELVKTAKEKAKLLLEKGLNLEKNQPLKERLDQFERDIHEE